MVHSPLDALAKQLKQARKHIVVGADYAHYKWPGKTYTVVDLVILESSEEVMVVYRPTYAIDVSFARPLSSWLEQVPCQGATIPRFRKL